MAIIDIYSKRSKNPKGKIPDVYQYDRLPEPFRVQVVHILDGMFGKYEGVYAATREQKNWFCIIQETLAREYGVFRLHPNSSHVHEEVRNVILQEAKIEKVLDTIELSFNLAEQIGSDKLSQHKRRLRPGELFIPVEVEDAITELNYRFHENGIGYQYESRKIIEFNSQFLHEEVTRSALSLLRDTDFAGAETEFLKAHKRYREQQYEDVISECLKAFESTLKIICSQKKWTINKKATAKQLIETVFANGLIPDYLQSKFNSLRSTLESGVPTTRNQKSGHGRGNEPRHIPRYLAGYMLHLTASTIVFLVDASKD